jgi:hypothetical protein
MYCFESRLKGVGSMLHFGVSPEDDDPPKEDSPITIHSASLYEIEAKVRLQKMAESNSEPAAPVAGLPAGG